MLSRTPHLFTIEEYRKLGEAGVLEGVRVELLNGEIVDRSPIGHRHATVTRRLVRLFSERIERRFWLDPEKPFILDAIPQPHPDLALLQPGVGARDDLPIASDVSPVVEISDSSLKYDRGQKLPAYARGGILEVWIINLLENVIEAYRDPVAGAYRRISFFRRGDAVAPQSFPDLEVRVDRILP